MNRQTHPIEIQAKSKHTDMQTGIGRLTDRQTYRWIPYADKHRARRKKNKQIDRKVDRKTDRQAYKRKDDRQKDKQTDRWSATEQSIPFVAVF